jgi:hypothetical protein
MCFLNRLPNGPLIIRKAGFCLLTDEWVQGSAG